MCWFNGLSQKDKNSLRSIVKAKLMGVQLSIWSHCGQESKKKKHHCTS